MKKKFIEVDCQNTTCPQFHTCCKLPTEVISDTDTVDILFYGQGAGYVEESKLKPFVGPAGKRLRQLINHAWTEIGEFSVALTNNVRCHPIGANNKDRAPNDIEITECRGHLIKDIQKLSPKLIIPVGNSAMSTFFEDGKTMSNMHGKIVEKKNVLKQPLKIMPTYHPSYIIRRHGTKFNSKKLESMDSIFMADMRVAYIEIDKQ